MNTQDPLAQLRDIHLPQAISWWPPAIGWWLLGLLALLLVALLFYCLRRYYLATAFRREGKRLLLQLYRLWQREGDSQGYLQGVNEVLKRTALLRFPGEDTASLSGERWTNFLDRQFDAEGKFSGGPLSHGPYAPGEHGREDLAEVQRLALRWVNRRRKPRRGAPSGAALGEAAAGAAP